MKSKLLILLVMIAFRAFSQPASPLTAVPVDIASKPVLLWKFKTNGPIVGTPVIDQETVFIGSLDSTLYALDLPTGKLKWKLPTNGGIRSSVCASKLGVYLLNTDGFLYRIEKDSGKVNGYYQAMNGFMGDCQADYADYFISSPVIVDSLIYFGSGNDIYALSIVTGNLQWTYKTDGPVHTTPAITRTRLFAGSFDGHLYAFDLKTGALAWKFKTTGNYGFPKGEVMGNPVVAAGMVFAGARDYNVYALDARGGYANWIKQLPLGWGLPLTVNDSVLYLGSSDDRSLFALNLLTGKEVWRNQTGFNILGGCAIGDTMGYFGTLAGKLHGINLKTGNIIWTVESESYKANHLKYLTPDDAYRPDIFTLVKNPLDMLKMYEHLGGIFGKPARDGERLVVAGYDGWIYCYSAGTPPEKNK